jgi:hypothetical protein
LVVRRPIITAPGGLDAAPSAIKNKVQKSGAFLEPEKVSVSTPQFTTNPPQLHHDLPTRKRSKSAKPPAKLPFCLSKDFSSICIEKLRETCNYP